MSEKRSIRKTERKPRLPVSCAPCRSKKLKCNRSQPCQNCIVRDKPSSCIYEGSEHGRPTLAYPTHAVDMQKRIDRLEALVTNLVSQGQNHTDTRTSPANGTFMSNPGLKESQPLEEVQHGIGVMQVNDKHSIYRGSTHWAEILEELNELKNAWSQVQDQDSNLQEPLSEAVDGASLLCGLPSPISKEDLLATLPEKPRLDKLIDRFFVDHGSPPYSFHILHQATFMKQYEEHFCNPSKTEIMWLGLLFSMLSLIMLSYHSLGDEPPEYEGATKSLFELYRVRTAQCLMLGDITKCAPYTLETMIYNTLAEQARKGDGETRVWLMTGLLVRVALQMGYHRDPSQYPGISIFQGEMRRRVWAFVQGIDTLMSFLVGLPSSTRALDSDTMEPRNLYIWELSEDMTSLPPSHPITEYTPMLYLLCKSRVLIAIGEIVHYLSSLKSYSNSRVLELDSSLQEAFSQVPPLLRFQPDSSQIDDPLSLYDRKAQLHFLYHQGMCTLHRKFLSQPRFSQSRERCIQSALALVELQCNLYEHATMKGEDVKRHWYRISYTTHEFILAAMILAMDLRRNAGENSQRGQILESLLKARLVWKEDREKSPMAVKVYTVLSNMLQSLGVAEPAALGPVVNLPMQNGFDAGQFMSPPEEENLVFGTDMDIDWAIWDQFIEGVSFEDAYSGASTTI